MLVCGRPGSGCTTLLKIISNSQEEFEAVSGKVHYGSSTPNEAREFRGHIVMNTEDDVHFPTLKVDQTMDFATSTKLPKGSGKEHITSTRDFILGSLGIGHTISTMVGNETVRGVSGGERKRVSLAEVMATQVLHADPEHIQCLTKVNVNSGSCPVLGQLDSRP
jgi:ATP-binding cassette subfamily G (WHITE) protein 2 (SNQ2)